MAQNQLKWTLADKAYIMDHCNYTTDKELAEYFTQAKGFPVNIEMVRKVRQRLGIKKAGGPLARRYIGK